MDIADIRERAQGVKDGAVLPDELQYAREILEHGAGDIASALYIVGYCGDKSDARRIEKYLSNEKRDLYGELALKSLCRYLGLVNEYRHYIRMLIMSPVDIGWRNSRMTAIQLSAEYYEEYEDKPLGCHLLQIAMDPEDDDQDAARYALIKILKISEELSSPLTIASKAPLEDTQAIEDAAKRKFDCSGYSVRH